MRSEESRGSAANLANSPAQRLDRGGAAGLDAAAKAIHPNRMALRVLQLSISELCDCVG
jgi:hypothetical protein